MEYMGYVYVMTTSRPNGIKYYVCDRVGCNCTAKKSRQGQVTIIRPHNHPAPEQISEDNEANDIRVELIALKNALKEKAINTNDKLIDIYRSESVRYPRGAAFYSWHSACSLMNRHRKNCMPAEPNTINDLENLFKDGVLDRFCINGKTLYRGCVIEGGKTSMIFACHALVDLILRVKPDNMYIDSSFRVVPKKPRMTQLFTVHFEIDNYSFPVIYCLMEGDCHVSYDSVLYFIKDILLPNYCPRKIFSNLNTDLINAIANYFSTATIDCTWFHHNQMLCEKMIEFGYLNLIKDNEFVFKCLKMLMVLPLLPPNKIQAGFDELKMYAARMQVQIPRIFNYYRRYWLTQIGRNNLSMLLKPAKTINNIFVFHKMFNSSFRNYPTIWKLLDSMYNLNNIYLKVASQLSLRNNPNKTLQCQTLYNDNKIKTNIRQFLSSEISIQYFLLLSSDCFNDYEKYLRTSIIKMSIINGVRNLNDEDDIVTDIANMEDENELFDYEPQQQQLERQRELERRQQQENQNRQRNPQQQHGQQQWEHQQQEQEQQQRLEQIITIDDNNSVANSPHSSELDDESSRRHGFCMVCFTTRNNFKYIIVPCGHSWICQKCREQNFINCPYCRDDVFMFVRVLETSIE